MPAAIPLDQCVRCRGPLDDLGTREFRFGGTKGGWKLFMGEWAELGEDMMALRVHACRTCRSVEFRV